MRIKERSLLLLLLLSRLTFLKACRLDVFLIKHHDKYRFTREKKSIETKDKKRTGPQSE